MRGQAKLLNAVQALLFSKDPRRKAYAVLVLVSMLLAVGWSQLGKANSDAIEGKVVGVADGDTITVLDAGLAQHKIRFAFIDAPEKNQAWGQRAKQALSDKVFGEQVKVVVVDRDKYGRVVGHVWLGETDINLSQLSDGMAWHYVQFAKKLQSGSEFDRYQLAQQQARDDKRGLWQDADPTPPWAFRRGKGRARQQEFDAMPTPIAPAEEDSPSQ
ncbi:endonuclease YncB(thermonuclease family) [Chitinivorax tropicus]|uniref:Endonuclease YncB(Thermonuclease family) n=1 Tax=Chitinivorax tropicus TaxID=714531 RepID=A0A840MK80_9PROT|nr:thermonuclease family protein [Chitinivorax tropicus]MBB5018810.1 endonuclease YncB(thermonuclease family) [Chitinivorax tropicus]